MYAFKIMHLSFLQLLDLDRCFRKWCKHVVPASRMPKHGNRAQVATAKSEHKVHIVCDCKMPVIAGVSTRDVTSP